MIEIKVGARVGTRDHGNGTIAACDAGEYVLVTLDDTTKGQTRQRAEDLTDPVATAPAVTTKPTPRPARPAPED